MSAPSPIDFRQHYEVETPEQVSVDYELAGIGSRALACIYDTVLLLGMILASLLLVGALIAVLGTFFAGVGAWIVIALLALNFAGIWGYFALYEGLRQGQTPGKRRLGIRVIRDTGHAVTLRDAMARNLLRFADFLPFGYLLGGLIVAVHPRGKRLGDMVAGTIVVRDRPIEHTEAAEPASAELEEAAGAPELSDDEFRLVREYSERAAALPVDVRLKLAARLAERFAERYPEREKSSDQFLFRLYRIERARRRGRFGARTGGSGGAQSVAERLVARKSGRWNEFQAVMNRASARGLDALQATDLPDFAARYREVAADLARARTYRADVRVLQRLERLVAGGHNLLYRDERHTWRLVWRFVARECPAAVVRARRYVLLAFLTFGVPALGAYLLLRERPALAEEVLPAVLLARADAGAERLQRGRGYGESERAERPLVATSIITNNVQVAFVCFALGIFGGVGSLVSLAFNGAMIGAATGLFANRHLAGYLWTFVIGHGVLELFAIWVAGAAGFLLGRVLIAPGRLRRADALALSGRFAMSLIGACVVLLVIAGSIEGFLSTSRASLGVRAAVSTGSVIFLVLYLWSGARYRGGTPLPVFDA